MKRDNWPVENEGIRSSKPDECYYCQTQKGETHKPTCVIRKRTVVVKVEMELVVDVPEDWDKDNIEYYLNEKKGALGIVTEELECLDARLENADNDGEKISVSIDYVREATAEDEAKQLVFVKDLPS